MRGRAAGSEGAGGSRRHKVGWGSQGLGQREGSHRVQGEAGDWTSWQPLQTQDGGHGMEGLRGGSPEPASLLKGETCACGPPVGP